MKSLLEIDETHLQILLQNSKMPLIIEFMDPFCIICKTMKERINEVMRSFGGAVVFLRININSVKLAQLFQVDSVPSIVYIKNGVVVARHVDFPDKEVIEQTLTTLVSA